MPDHSFKVSVQRSKETTIHRFRGEFSFDGLATVLGHIYGSPSKKLVIEYDDDEGDRVRVASELEWAECLRLRGGDAAVKLFVRRGKGDERSSRAAKRGDANAEGSDGEADAPTEAAATEAPTTVLPKLKLPVASSPAASHVSRSEPLPVLSPPKPAPSFECLCESEADKLVLRLVSTLFGCDAARELLNPVPAVDFGSCVRRVVDPLRHEVHIDIDRQILRHRAIVTANARIDAGDYAGAERILVDAGSLFPQDSIIDYNLACVAALQGNAERAIFHLESAVSHGYDKVAHLEKDADLASIVTDPRVVAIIRKLRGEAEPAVAAAAAAAVTTTLATAVVAEPAVAAPVIAPAPVDPNVRAVMSIFPDLAEADIVALLAERGNNVHRVVDFLLNA